MVRGATNVAGKALMFNQPAALVRPASVNGAAGAVVTVQGQPIAVMGFTVSQEKIVAIHVIADPDRLRRLELPLLD